MNKRLPPCAGEWIDRNRTIEFRFEGVTYQGYAGDVLSSALWANGVRMLGRSFKYHRPRGIYSLAGHDANVMVENGAETNLRGDRLLITPGMDVRAVNTVGGLRRDRLRVTEWFSRYLPVGFYYKAFHTPRRMFPFYERQMRKAAGLGRINPSATSPHTPKDYAFCDLLVVGGGPSGLSAAISAAEQGVQVLLVDENPQLGGSFLWQHARNPDARRELDDLLSRAGELENLSVRLNTQAGGYYSDQWIALFDGQRMTKLRARATLIASGSIEQPAVFENNDLPGVMLASAAQRLLHLYAVKPAESVVVLTANDDGYRAAVDLHAAGVKVHIVDPRDTGEPSGLAQAASAAGISIQTGTVVQKAIPVKGKSGICAAQIVRTGEARATSSQVECDGIIVSTGWAPNAALLYQAGVKFRYAEQVEQLVPREIPSAIFAAGRVNGVYELSDRIADGRRAGLAAAACLGKYGGEIPSAPIHQGVVPSHAYPVFSSAGNKAFVDFDEDLQLVDIVNAHQEGYDNIELLKRYSTAGMGPSQGKLANMNAVRILAKLNGKSIDETGTTTSRPFYQPVRMALLAGRRFHPLRRTPMHAWHVTANAEMIHAGAWMRPEYYHEEQKSRSALILAEAVHVRNAVGLIDVGTLGKIYVHGPDAAAFLERIYTGRFSNQRVGRLRYGLACDETGVIVEDGVVARVAADQFYVTATSSGVAAFYRELQRWAILFGMDVQLVNATGHLTAMNLAGPQSREVLEQLTDLDLAHESFPYLGVREAEVAGVPAVLMRVGFVGELGYEIHVPASYGLHVWTAIMKAGQAAKIRPFGLEAQRLLRLEKGHFIVGHDTDALTNPFEADAAWAIGRGKSYFVGSRSLEIVRRRPLTRRLAGVVFSEDQRTELPQECHLVIHKGDIAGRITSIAPETTLGHPIGMAFLHPDLCEPGQEITVRIDGGKAVQCRVASMPFYDPEHTRQG